MSRSAAAWWSAAGAVALIVVWEAVVRIFDVRPFVLLAPSKILSSFLDDPGFYLSDAWVTARHLLVGIAISLVVTFGAGWIAVTGRRASDDVDS